MLRMGVGVDWKSLTIPACLPITTDYFPDQRSLHNDYVVSDYTLLPDSVNAEYASNRAIYRKPLTTDEVFRELISQRLAQVTRRRKKSLPPDQLLFLIFFFLIFGRVFNQLLCQIKMK